MIANKNRTTAELLTTSNKDVYVAPPLFKAVVDSIVISNSSGSPVTVTLEWLNKSTNVAVALLGATSIPANNFIQLRWSMAIDQEDVLRALASTTGVVTVTIHVTETYTTSTL